MRRCSPLSQSAWPQWHCGRADKRASTPSVLSSIAIKDEERHQFILFLPAVADLLTSSTASISAPFSINMAAVSLRASWQACINTVCPVFDCEKGQEKIIIYLILSLPSHSHPIECFDSRPFLDKHEGGCKVRELECTCHRRVAILEWWEI